MFPTFEEFLKKKYEELPQDKRPTGFYGHMSFFLQMEKLYKTLYVYNDGK